MFKFTGIISLVIFFQLVAHGVGNENDLRKSHLEDIFIWKISDELKLSVQQEKKFTEINKLLNKKKSEINKKIQEAIANLAENDSGQSLTKYKKLIQDYNQVSIDEFESIKKILGTKKFIHYLKIKSELTSKVKTLLVGDKLTDTKRVQDAKTLPPPKVIIEKN